MEDFSQNTLQQICLPTMTTKVKRETDRIAVYMAETTVLNMLPTGNNETEEASLYDNHTSLNVTSPYLNNFYFYKVSYFYVNRSLVTNVYQSMSVNVQTIDHFVWQSMNRLQKAAHRCHCFLRRKGTVAHPSCPALPFVVSRHIKKLRLPPLFPPPPFVNFMELWNVCKKVT
jgi:hypothetical protein